MTERWEMSNEELGAALARTGWLDAPTSDPAELESAVKSYQQWWGLTPDGWAGPVTARSLNAIRMCAHPDRMRLGGEVCKWDRDLVRDPLKWFVSSSLPGLSRDVFVGAITEALDLWSAVAAVAHVQVSNRNEADTLVTTGRIDGPGRTLAWWELPCGPDVQRTGKVDDREPWVVAVNPPPNRISLVIVLAHEFGHLLGLEHTNVQRQLMNPIYNPAIPRPQPAWDIPQAVKRYGEPSPSQPPGPSPGDPGGGDNGVAGMAFFPDTGVVVWEGRVGRVVWD